MIGKAVKIDAIGNYKWFELDEKETEEIINKTIEINDKIFHKLVVKFGGHETKILAIFEKVGVSSFTVMKSELDKKVNDYFRKHKYGR